ncbi:MAG: marine proteobacterial sortase target protein [Acidobacteriota bacterium]
MDLRSALPRLTVILALIIVLAPCLSVQKSLAFNTQPTQAEPEKKPLPEQPAIQIDDHPGEGVMLGRGGLPIPLKQTDVKVSIVGFIASVDVEQTFTNSYQETIEAVYIFPLPSEAAVDDMEIRVGGRTIRGSVKEREEARRTYEQARDAGLRAGLIEQERPNIFTTSVANIPPSGEIVVHIHYTERLNYDNGEFRFSFPMVVAPRYIPGATGRSAAASPVTDATRISPPVLKDKRLGSNIFLTIDLNAGIPIKKLRSLSHEIKTEKQQPAHYSVQLARLDEIPNKDFVLQYKIAGEQPEATIMQALGTKDQGYFLLMAAPPSDFQIKDLRAKEMIFIIDTSGSMSGEKILQAKNALRSVMRGLNPQDTFNIIRFSTGFSAMSATSLPFTQENINTADRFIDSLVAAGGTEMLPPLLHALQQPQELNRLRVIVFITDGQIGNEAQLLQQAGQKLGNARIFTFGVDSAVNEYFLKKLAQIGRGTAEFLLPRQQNIETIINRFQSRISAPMLTDLAIDWAGLDILDVYPNPLPDLYVNQPIFIVGRFRPSNKRQISLQALSAIGLTSLPVTIDTTTSNARLRTLSALWARTRIENLTDRLLENPNDPSFKDEITRLAIEHHLLSPFTSFVAFEEQLVVPPTGGPAQKVIVPVTPPEDWESFDRKVAEEKQRRISTNAQNAAVAATPLISMGPSNAPQGKVYAIKTSPDAGASAPSPRREARGHAAKKSDSVLTDSRKSAPSRVPQPNKGIRERGGISKPGVLQTPQTKNRDKSAMSVGAGSGSGYGTAVADGRTSSLGGVALGTTAQPPIVAAEPAKEAPPEALKPGFNSEELAGYLARNQAVNGLWNDQGVSEAEALHATTLAALAFVSHGHTTRRGNYQPQLRRTIERIIANLDSNGQLKAINSVPNQTEIQALTLWLMSESVADSSSTIQQKAAETLLIGLLKLRSEKGLWRARTDGEESATATVWAILALRSAQKAGLNVDNRMFESAEKALAGRDQDKLALTTLKALAGNLSTTEANQFSAQLRTLDWKNSPQLETMLFALIAARKLDEATYQELLARLSSTDLNRSRPVVAAATYYLALGVGRGLLVALQ